jgi:hypothetical protein
LLADNNNLREKSAFFAIPNKDFLKNAFFLVETIEMQRRGISAKANGRCNHRHQKAR